VKVEKQKQQQLSGMELVNLKEKTEMATSQQRIAEIEKQEQTLAEEKKKLLEASKAEDLEAVKKLCKLHGFTATQLRGCLATKGNKKKTAAIAKPAAKKTLAKKAAKK